MRTTLSILCVLVCMISTSQNMTNQKLEQIITSTTDSIEGSSGRWQFKINDVIFICLTDSTNNRMRIISPIAEASAVDNDAIRASMIANFHTALDVKYAIADNILWSAYIHPLKELTEDQVKDAISQVYYANVNFGTTYASTSLIFPGREDEKEETPKKKGTLEKRKF